MTTLYCFEGLGNVEAAAGQLGEGSREQQEGMASDWIHVLPRRSLLD